MIASAPRPPVLEVLPQDAAEHFNRALEHDRQGDEDHAERELRRALAIRPDYPKALNNLGRLLARRGETDEAITCFEAAIRSDPSYPRPYNNLGILYWRQGRFDWAAAQFRRALLADPSYEAARSNLAAVGSADVARPTVKRLTVTTWLKEVLSR